MKAQIMDLINKLYADATATPKDIQDDLEEIKSVIDYYLDNLQESIENLKREGSL